MSHKTVLQFSVKLHKYKQQSSFGEAEMLCDK